MDIFNPTTGEILKIPTPTLQQVTDIGATTTNTIKTPAIQALTSAGGAIKSHSGATVAEFGQGGGRAWTFEDGVKLNGGTESRVLLTDASKNIAYSTLTSAELEAIPTTYVPYTGATDDVDLNLKNLTNVNTLGVKQDTTEAVIMGDVSGDARGTQAVDIQSYRSDPTFVASGYQTTVYGINNIATGDNNVAMGVGNSATGSYDSIVFGSYNSNTKPGVIFGVYNYLYGNEYGSGNGFCVGNSNESYGGGFNYGTQNLGFTLCYNFGSNNIATSGFSGGAINVGNGLYNQSEYTTRIGDGTNGNNYISYSASGLVTKNSDVALEQIQSTGNILATDYQSVGPEKIANGSFTTNTTGWTIGSFTRNAGGYMRKTTDGDVALSQASGSMTSAPVIGEYYLFQFDYNGPIVGTVTPSIAGVTLDPIGTRPFTGLNIDYKYITKTFSYIIKATATTGPAFTPSDDFRVDSIDNISLKRITGGDLKAIGGIKLETGAAASTAGTTTLVAGTKVVNTTAVTANSIILLTGNVDGGTVGYQRVTARTAGTSFTITSSSATDTSSVGWLIINPI